MIRFGPCAAVLLASVALAGSAAKPVQTFRYKLPSLQEYVLISQDLRRVELYRRGPGVGWTFLTFERDEVVKLSSLNLELSLATIYEDTDVP